MKFPIVRIGVRLLCMAGLAVAISSCTGGTRVSEMPNTEKVWPAVSDVPRIAYVGSVTKPEDLDISLGFLSALKAVAIGEEDTSLSLPMAVVENNKQQLFVADSGKKGIHRFDIKRGDYHFIRQENGNGFVSPVGMAADSSGNVYITDSELAKVFIIPLDEEHARSLDLPEDFNRPTGIAVDKKSGWIYVVDTAIHGIYLFQSDTTFIKKFGHRGTQDGEFNFPTYLWQNKDGDLLVTDSLNFRIQMFDRFGNYLTQFGSVGNGTGDQARPKGVAEDDQGHIYVTDSLFHTVQIFDKAGRFLLNFGDQGDAPGQFWLPLGIHITQAGTIYVADSYNKRVQIFRYIGSEL